jgi:TM2 domain-containing membrane protein YozV
VDSKSLTKDDRYTGISAIAYVMATRLATELGKDVNIGIIDINFNGSTVEAWMSADNLAEVDPEYSKKSRALAGHLGIFFGFLGIHNFYLGYVAKGIVKILMSTLGIALCGMGPFISLVWGFIEGIFILCDNINYDASGRKLRKLGEKKR